MPWNNEISLILVKMSSKYKAQVALLKFSLFFTLAEALTGEISQTDALESYLVLPIKSREGVT